MKGWMEELKKERMEGRRKEGKKERMEEWREERKEGKDNREKKIEGRKKCGN